MSFSVLVNGTPSGLVRGLKGLRPGDPLSSYMFILVLKTLSYLFLKANDGRFLLGWHVSGGGGEGVEISHLLFIDDTLMFCELSHDQLTYLSWLLMWFEAISRLKVNLDKSELIPIRNVENAVDLAREFSSSCALLASYLGFPFGAPFRYFVRDGVEERLRRRLTLWNRQYLSIKPKSYKFELLEELVA